jgi:hypothetical protein
VYSANLKIGQLAAYLQDDINFNERFKLTVGLRVDVPVYLESPLENPTIKAFTFPGADGTPTNYSTGKWPKASPVFSPRIGFRWDAVGDKSLIVRGGAGLFTGRFPFVFLTNMPTNSQMYQGNVALTTPAQLSGIRFNPDPTAYRSQFPSVAGGPLPSGASPVLVDPNFKFPQVARLNIAADKRLGDGWSVTFEGIFNKDVNAIRMRNANEKAPDARFNGVDSRPRYSQTGNGAGALALRRIYTSLPTAIVLENTNRGGGLQLTTQLTKSFSKGFFATAAYTYTAMFDVTSNPGSTAASVWNSNATTGTQNDLMSGWANAAIPHRFIASTGYTFKYLKALATTVTLFYEGSPQGNFSYVYQNDMNGDGNAADLMYVPRSQSEIIFVPITGSTPFSAQQQWDAFNQFIENSSLKNRRGGYTNRNEALLPWVHNVNLQVQQDFSFNIGDRKHTFRLQADVLNFTNMLNKNWGVRYFNYSGNTGNVTPLVFDSADPTTGAPRYRMQVVGGRLPTTPFQLNRSVTSVWGAQLGLRYIF